MADIDRLRDEATRKQRENLILARAYQMTLSRLAPANFILVVGAALLSLTAGATILIGNDLLTEFQSGILALISGAFTIIHSRLNCEQYQADCKKLLGFHRGMAADYENLLIIGDAEELKQRLTELNNEASVLQKSTTVLPFHDTLKKAQQEYRQ